MKIPETFKPEKDLEEKTKSLLERPEPPEDLNMGYMAGFVAMNLGRKIEYEGINPLTSYKFDYKDIFIEYNIKSHEKKSNLNIFLINRNKKLWQGNEGPLKKVFAEYANLEEGNRSNDILLYLKGKWEDQIKELYEDFMDRIKW